MKDFIPMNRLFLYLLFIGLLPVLLATYYVVSEIHAIDATDDMIELVYTKMALQESREGINRAVREQYSEADHHYIDKTLEKLPLLSEEREALQKVSKQKTGIFDDRLVARLKKLKSDNNLVFSEGVVQSYPGFQETVETLTHPVEVSVSDVKHILTMVEGVDMDGFHADENMPQLLVTQFSLNRKKISEHNEVFELNMKLLKREFY